MPYEIGKMCPECGVVMCYDGCACEWPAECTKMWCWSCGKAPSGETGDPPFCIGCGQQAGPCGEPAEACGLCLDHCLNSMLEGDQEHGNHNV